MDEKVTFFDFSREIVVVFFFNNQTSCHLSWVWSNEVGSFHRNVKSELEPLKRVWGGYTKINFKVAHNSFQVFFRLIELGEIFQAWTCTILNAVHFF